MYHRPTKERLIEQIFGQKVLLENIRTSLVIKADNVYPRSTSPTTFCQGGREAAHSDRHLGVGPFRV